MLYLIVTHDGREVRRISIPSAGRLDDNRPHHVIIDRQGRQVSRITISVFVLVLYICVAQPSAAATGCGVRDVRSGRSLLLLGPVVPRAG